MRFEGLFELPFGDEGDEGFAEAAATLMRTAEEVGVPDSRRTRHVIEMSLEMGRRLGMDKDRLRVVAIGALFHDIGVTVVPEEIIDKPGDLTDAEREVMRSHVEAGFAMLSKVDVLWEAATAVRHHHEWYNGSGYPDGLAGDAIPIESRVIAVPDMYEAVTTPRPYRRALDSDVALAMMRAEVGTHFDPVCFAAFEETLAERNGNVIPLFGRT